ncbi:MAG TPA: hypothetical protein VJQ82_16135 [Terriglobales bacterium]|nr:hypothetical protein [Terriglobales bacterium]
MTFAVQKVSATVFALVLGAGLAAYPAFAADKTFKGEVSDALCGKKHMMEGDSASCTHACVAKGSAYALVVGDKVYTLDAKDKAALMQLDKLAGKQASVKGTADGDTITVSSVMAAK